MKKAAAVSDRDNIKWRVSLMSRRVRFLSSQSLSTGRVLQVVRVLFVKGLNNSEK